MKHLYHTHPRPRDSNQIRSVLESEMGASIVIRFESEYSYLMETGNHISLQERYSPKSICFGCGPMNPQGLHIQSHVQGDQVVAEWKPDSHHEAFPGMLNGGIIGSLLDCHSNWTAAWHLMKQAGQDQPPCTVTAEYSVKLLRPTPTDSLIRLSAKVIEAKADRAVIEAELLAGGKICATCRGTFVAVKPGHPAFHRW